MELDGHTLWYRQFADGAWVPLASGSGSVCRADQEFRRDRLGWRGSFVILAAGGRPNLLTTILCSTPSNGG